ncbi:GNAT family acetyltransferase [uncultured Sphingomonas sp.]|uniref:GNAT family acetyltransferase n=1 Tax=uncultured Sphingomonas sp. TaxID=158754 RepID=UPI0035CC476E
MIRTAQEADSAAVVSLWRVCGLTRPWNDPDADFRLALRGAGSTVLITPTDGALVGSVMIGFDGHRGWLYYLSVDPAHRSQGIGRTLVEAAERWLAAKGLPKVQLMVRSENQAVQGLYERLGYEPQLVVVFGKRLMVSAN